MSEEQLQRCEVCGVIVADPPADASGDLLCPECTDHLGDAAARVLHRAAAAVRALGEPAETEGWTVEGTTVREDDGGVCARCTFAEDAAWIAVMSPALAEPLAAWLEWAAVPPQEALHQPAALVMARAVLAGQP